jgi:GxxExxY protein
MTQIKIISFNLWEKIKYTIMTENDISYIIRGAIFKVYNELGPGLLESVYEEILAYELSKQGLDVMRQTPIPVYYDNIKMDIGFRSDILVNNKVIIELKSTESISEVHHKQIITYLKLSKLKLGILVNFNTNNIADSIYRKVNNLAL